MATTHERRHLDSIAKFLINTQNADLEIKCGERTFYVHKAIVCPAAPFLSTALKHDFKESKANTITHEEFDADTVELVLTYIYVHDYATDDNNMNTTSSFQHKTDATSPGDVQVNRRLIAHARVFGLADYWGMSDLMSLASQKFTSEGKTGPLDYGSFVDVIKEAHLRSSSSTDELSKALRVVRRTHRHNLAGHEYFLRTLVECSGMQQFLVETIQELNDIARKDHHIVKLNPTNRANCGYCGFRSSELSVNWVDDEGAEQKFVMKCTHCDKVFSRH